MRAKCFEYLQWCEDNPLYEEKLFAYQGEVTRARVDKMRMPTLGGMCVYLGISLETWCQYRDRFPDVTREVDALVRDAKLAGAAAELLNPNIVARDLGLGEKTEISGPNGGPIATEVTLNIKFIEP